MARHVFEATGNPNLDKEINKLLLGGWYLQSIFSPWYSSIKIGAYTRTVEGVTEYALVNRGTKDWWMCGVDDILKYIGMSADTMLSKDFAKQFVLVDYAGYEVTMVGHSKGGAEAMVNAIATNTNCITFNTLAMSMDFYCTPTEIRAYKESGAQVTHYVVGGDPLNRIFGKPSVGETILLNSPYSMTLWGSMIGYVFIDSHPLTAVQAAIEKARRDGRLK